MCQIYFSEFTLSYNFKYSVPFVQNLNILFLHLIIFKIYIIKNYKIKTKMDILIRKSFKSLRVLGF